MEHYRLKNYDILLPPYPLNFDRWTREQAGDYLKWFVSHIPERASYILQESIGVILPNGAIPSGLLVDVWKWFLQNAEIEYVPLQEVNTQRKKFGHLGESFICKTRLSVQTEYIVRDIAMLMSAVFTTNYPTLYWDFDCKPKRYIFINQPVLKGFLNTRYGKPFSDVFQPVHMVSVQAVKYLKGKAQDNDLFSLYQYWEKDIPSDDNPLMF